MAKGRMAEVVSQRDRLGEVLIQLQGARDVAGDARYFDGMGQAGAEMIASAIEEDLGFVFQPAKRAGVDDPIPVTLIMSAPFRRFLDVLAAARLAAELGKGSEKLPFAIFQFLAGAG